MKSLCEQCRHFKKIVRYDFKYCGECKQIFNTRKQRQSIRKRGK